MIVHQDPFIDDMIHVLFSQVLYHLHEHNVMHRDVKGHNLLITHSGIIKLIDFGKKRHYFALCLCCSLSAVAWMVSHSLVRFCSSRY